MRTRAERMRRASVLAPTAVVLAVLIASCAPVVQAPLPNTDAARQLDRTALIVYHRMAIGYLETGAYTTNVLVDVQLPAGARWTLQAYPQDGSSYRLKVTSTQVPGIAWEVTPSGVRRIATP